MAQAISNKVLVSSSQYCWMVCDYSMSGQTLNYTLSFHFDGGCAQLDNAWIKAGSTVIWQNTGRIHSYDSTAWNVSHNVSIHSGSATISGNQTITFGITKYSGVAVSGSFSVSGSTPPSGLSVSVNKIADTSCQFNVSLTSYGTPSSTDGRYIEAALMNHSGSYGGPYRYAIAKNVNSATITVDNNSSSSNPITITPNTKYWFGGYASNTATSTNVMSGEVITLPAYISNVTANDTGHGVIEFNVQHATEGNAAVVTTEYSLNDGEWTETPEAFSLTIAGQATVKVRRKNSSGITPEFVVSVTPFVSVKLYSSVNNSAKEIKKLYGSVNNESKKIRKLYGSVNGKSKLIFEDLA